jgi:hypothetical protein
MLSILGVAVSTFMKKNVLKVEEWGKKFFFFLCLILILIYKYVNK